MNYLETTLAQIACNIPGATRVFHKYKLDFCCGGKKSLADAIADRSFTAEQIVADLDAVATIPTESTDWRTAEPAELIEHLLSRYHALHREQLPELVRLAKRVEHVHGDRHDCPKGLAALLSIMHEELEAHMQKEEQILFPLICDGLYEMAHCPIQVMEHEHDQHGDHLAELDRLTDNITPPPFACVTWRALYTGLNQLKEDLMSHIHLENNILFPTVLDVAKV